MSNRTDADRSRLVMGCQELEGRCCWSPEVYQREFWQEGNMSASNFFDMYKDVFYKHFDGETPFTFDLRRGQTEAAIAYVNGGANDFNCARDLTKHRVNDISTPSLHVASLFGDALFAFAVCLQKDCANSLNDLLYIYNELKAKGLNQAVIDEYEKQNPDVTMSTIFSLMNKYGSKPEDKRWNNVDKDALLIAKITTPTMARIQRKYNQDMLVGHHTR